MNTSSSHRRVTRFAGSIGALVVLAMVATGCADADASGDAAAADWDGTVPALHPEVDDWPATLVTFTTSDGAAVEVAARVADTAERRQRGLMQIEDIPEGAGMLFMFDEEAEGSFWMKETLVPLDIAFLGPEGDVRAVLTMEPCPDGENCEIYSPGVAFQHAVEVPAGYFTDAGVQEGASASWPDPSAP